MGALICGEKYTDTQIIHRVEYRRPAHQHGRARKTETWRRKDGLYHREDGPACIVTYASSGEFDLKVTEYYRNGLCHNLRGPAKSTFDFIGPVKSDEWYVYGKRTSATIILNSFSVVLALLRRNYKRRMRKHVYDILFKEEKDLPVELIQMIVVYF